MANITAVRFSPTLLQPMRRFVQTDGFARYEVDTSRPYVEVGSGENYVTIDTIGPVDSSGKPIVITDPINLSNAEITQPFLVVPTRLIIDAAKIAVQLVGTLQYLAIEWAADQLTEVLRTVAPNFAEQGTQGNSKVVLRIVLGNPIQEVRFDWSVSNSSRTFTLPGVQVKTPDTADYSLVFSNQNQENDLRLLLTAEKGQFFTANSTFAWERNGQRELQNDEKQFTPNLFELTATAGKKVSLVLIKLALKGSNSPTFFQQLNNPLTQLNFDVPNSLAQPILGRDANPLEVAAWSIEFKYNLKNLFKLPFLQRDEKSKDGDRSQFIEIGQPEFADDPPTFNKNPIEFLLPISVAVGSLKFATKIQAKFNWETFALSVNHEEGIKLLSLEENLPEQDYLGLTWKFRGTPAKDENGKPIKDKNEKQFYHYFTLVTQDYNYQIQQAKGAVFEISYTRASDEPIVFEIEQFALTPNGINLTAEVTDRPAKLNGIDTKFRFHGSRLEIKENRINDFTLSGSGPLPPALVGDAIADIALQFSQREGNLTLVAGSAKLKGNQLLKCQGTRFQFSIDALGLKFVNDGKFHLYFTLTGSAQFTPLPSDDSNFALALLQVIKIDLVECPLTGDARVISKHVKFLIELPKPKSFNFLGCFEMELRAIGFIPQATEFGAAPAMELSGQLKFAQGVGDTPNSRPDLHRLMIALPEPGSILPRIHFKELAVNLNIGEAFRLNGSVSFKNSPEEQGFDGEGTLEIQGLPTIAASFAFLRVRRDESSPWLRAWFIYLEARKVSFRIPVVELYIREVGLGFGYRYTLVSIKEADRQNDLKKLLKSLRDLSRTQGDLSKRDRWAVDLEAAGEDPRWTIVLRALISQTSASPSPLRWEKEAERVLPCVFLFDTVIAFRSDLTFFMAARAWINTNYYDYVTNLDGKEQVQGKPLFSGFVLLSPRRKRFLAQVSSNPEGFLGARPPMPEIVQEAIRNSQFAATVLIEPGLMHYELGWPNMLRWGMPLGPLKAEARGGFIFRVSKKELVLGVSYLARATLDIKADFDFGFIGCRVRAFAQIAYGARLIGVIGLAPNSSSGLYGAIGLEVQIQFSIEFWLRIKLLIKKITLSFRFSLTIGFTVGLEVGLVGKNVPGLRGSGTIAVSCMGHTLQLNIKLGVNEEQVKAARALTDKFLKVGLEATDVEPVPGVTPRAVTTARSLRSPDRSMASNEVPGVTPGAVTPAQSLRSLSNPELSDETELRNGIGKLDSDASKSTSTLSVPNYSIFVIRKPNAQDEKFFVLLPQGEIESGFLPVPPDKSITVTADFCLIIPKVTNNESPEGESPESTENTFKLDWFNPKKGDWDPIELNENSANEEDAAVSEIKIPLKANWNVMYQSNAESYELDENNKLKPKKDEPPALTLGEYISYAFVKSDDGTGLVDPQPLPGLENLVDERVQNSSENAFEAAVRGAAKQFRSSPYFKQDETVEYEQILSAAFEQNTTLYRDSGQVPGVDPNDPDKPPVINRDDLEWRKMQETQQAYQVRGMVIHDIVADVRQYAGVSETATEPLDIAQSIPFQMGLVFRFKGNPPRWLQDNGDTAQVRIQQRQNAGSTKPDSEEKTVRTFNIARATNDQTTFSTDYSENPPQFRHVKQFTDANTIALAWDLVWDQPAPANCTACQTDPEHHLHHYEVRRRALDTNEREIVYTRTPADALHRDKTNRIRRIRSRVQINDNFNQETLQAQATLPPEGRSYLYTITPSDHSGNLGRPLTLVATRFPNEPPSVPVDGELILNYHLKPNDFTIKEQPEVILNAEQPDCLAVHVEWSEPMQPKVGPAVAIDQYLLIFRKEETLPIGSYGLDSTTNRPRSHHLPTSNARQLPTDIEIKLDAKGSRNAKFAEIDVATLQAKGIIPPGNNPQWRPEAWRVFFQTVSQGKVRSALAPVQLLLRVEPNPSVIFTQKKDDRREERRLAELEWLPYPTKLPLLPPEDLLGIAGQAHFPMPNLSREVPRFDGTLNGISYQTHPTGIRCLRFRWNQGASHNANYPIDLVSIYHLHQLDIDAHTTETFDHPVKLGRAIRLLQDIQMLPAEDLSLAPNHTLTASQWEAWYPSTMRRKQVRSAAKSSDSPNPSSFKVTGSELPYSSWYSWRESRLVFPEWEGLTAGTNGQRTTSLHPLLQAMLDDLAKPKVEDSNATYKPDVQILPPFKASDLTAFLTNTATKTDPYGWNVLQRLGLSTTFSLYIQSNDKAVPQGKLVQGEALLNAVHSVLDPLLLASQWQLLKPHLHVELLFQPSQSVRLSNEDAEAQGLLALVQVSLRPTIEQYLQYAQVTVTGTAKSTVELLFSGANCTVINQSDSASGQTDLNTEKGAVRYRVTLPLTGSTTLLIRTGSILPKVEVAEGEGRQSPTGVKLTTVQPFAVTDDRSTYFQSPDTLAIDFSNASNPVGREWLKLKRYVESLNSNDADDPKITIPIDKERIEAILPDFQLWSQRFFDIGGDVTATSLEQQQHGVFAQTQDGIWLATAYPRAGSPAYATPDANGRLTYDHLLEDKWAHNYRFYIQPIGRYDLLWSSLQQSPNLIPKVAGIAAETLPTVMPDPKQAGLDIVLDRTQPVEMPVVLSSSRLDAPKVPKQPESSEALEPNVDNPQVDNPQLPPGATWEVIVAQHPEQSLMERNQTLARQLSFRQIAFTLLRRFADPDQILLLDQAVNEFQKDQAVNEFQKIHNKPHNLELKSVEDQYPALPTTPAQPDHLKLSGKLEESDAITLDLPQRLKNFQQGALVLQWQALPFFYEHQLLLIAQTSSQVSAINQITQRDFEYVAPPPYAIVEASDWSPSTSEAPAMRLRQIQIPLRQLWDSLPASAQAQWAAEQPDAETSTDRPRKLSSLPDLGVVYQIIETYSGNVEVQAEIGLERKEEKNVLTGKFVRKQLGRRFLAELVNLVPPDAQTPQARYILSVILKQVTEEIVQRSYPAVIIPEKATFDTPKLTITGILTRADRDDILLSSVNVDDKTRKDLKKLLTKDAEQPLTGTVPTDANLQQFFANPQDRQTFLHDFQVLDRIYQGWFSQEPISRPRELPEELPALKQTLDFPESENCTFVWQGTITTEEQAALRAIKADESFKAALKRLSDRAVLADPNAVIRENAVLGLDQVPQNVSDRIQFSIDATKRYTGLTWTGLLYDSDVEALQRWAQIPVFTTAINALIAEFDSRSISKTLPVPRPLQEELPNILQNQLQIGDDRLRWISPAPTDAQWDALTRLTGDTEFLNARNDLVSAINRDRAVPMVPERKRPQQSNLPDSIRNQLQIESSRLIWNTPLPTAQQRQAMQQLRGDDAFESAINQLLTIIPPNPLDLLPGAYDVPLGTAPLGRPSQADLPAAIRNQLRIEPGQLRWLAPTPTDAQRPILTGLSGDPGFTDALQRLLNEIDAVQTVPMNPQLRRPRQKDLPDVLKAQLQLTPAAQPTQITWTGRVHTPAQWQLLKSLATQGDPPFQTAMQEILDTLRTQPTLIAFDLPVRPQPEDLPENLRDKLLIGRSLMRYHGLMTLAEGQALQNLSELKPDRLSISRLYNASLNRGLQGRQLNIGTRRGSAAPRDTELTVKPLS
ncbi:hypothetical protein H6F86_13655 [Phormidium sp. FACHB-592]|uniref:Uncharacterized protein n=1 Tax=Stenomitos frigidus AS-A4 TaxID=2933935 RepID=A0ABV0KPC4_9CYAN|nr:hypothetical protein [Phormidium sp. FACHB-592]MBD2074922.1 hypothetical protein [Phormidium sp. FACHB-592]